MRVLRTVYIAQFDRDSDSFSLFFLSKWWGDISHSTGSNRIFSPF